MPDEAGALEDAISRLHLWVTVTERTARLKKQRTGHLTAVDIPSEGHELYPLIIALVIHVNQQSRGMSTTVG